MTISYKINMNDSSENVKYENERHEKLSFSELLKMMGPGIILTGISFGPGSLTTSAMLGAEFGYSLLWLFIPIIFMEMSFVLSSYSISLNVDRPIIHAIRHFYGSGSATFVGIALFIGCTFFTIGNITALGAGMNLIAGIDWKVGSTILSVFLLAVYFSKNVYSKVEKIISICLIVIVISFLVTLIAVGGPDWSEVGKGVVNWQLPAGSTLTAIGFLGSSANITTGVYGTYLAKEKKWTKKELHNGTILGDTGLHVIGIVLISGIIMLVGAVVLFPQSITISSTSELAKMLEPVMGVKIAAIVMGLALVASSFAALTGNTTRSVVLLNAGLDRPTNFEDNSVRWTSLIIIAISSLISFTYGGSPTQLILISNVLTNIATPVAGFFICRMMWNKDIFKNANSQKALSVCMVISYIIYLFFTINALSKNLPKLFNIIINLF